MHLGSLLFFSSFLVSLYWDSHSSPCLPTSNNHIPVVIVSSTLLYGNSNKGRFLSFFSSFRYIFGSALLSYLLFFIFNLSYHTVITHLALSDAKRFDKYYRQITNPSIRPSSIDNLELERLELDRINWNLAWVNRYLEIDALFLGGKKDTNSYRNDLTNLTKCG